MSRNELQTLGIHPVELLKQSLGGPKVVEEEATLMTEEDMRKSLQRLQYSGSEKDKQGIQTQSTRSPSGLNEARQASSLEEQMEVDGADSLNFPAGAMTEENETGEELPIEEITKSEEEEISEQPDFEKELDIAIEDMLTRAKGISENEHEKLRTLVWKYRIECIQSYSGLMISCNMQRVSRVF